MGKGLSLSLSFRPALPIVVPIFTATCRSDLHDPLSFRPDCPLSFRPKGEISTGRNPKLIASFPSQARKSSLVASGQTGHFPGESLENCEMPLGLPWTPAISRTKRQGLPFLDCLRPAFPA